MFIDIQDNVIVKGMGKLSMPVVPGNLISLPNFLGMHSVQKITITTKMDKTKYNFNSLEIRAFAVLLPSVSRTQCQVYSTEVKTS